MNRSHRIRTPAIVAAAAAVAMIAAGCGGSSGSSSSSSSSGAATASAPGITATQILIGSHQPLTGPAAPGYSEIAPGANAYFQYVNAHGGIYGRKIKYTYLDDGYDPSKTVSDVHQLILQDNVYAIFDGLGTPTHLAAVSFINSSKVPDVFVASGCDCWNDPSKYPETFGWQIDYIREGKILGAYIKQHFAGKKIGYFYQNDEFGQDGVKGLDDEIPHSQVVSRQTYVPPTDVNIGPQVAALKASGAQVVVSFAIPAWNALFKLTSLKLGFSPTLVASNVGTDPITLGGLLEAYAKKGGATVNGNQLTQGIITDGYLPTLGDTGNSWIALFKKVHDTYDAKAPFDGNVLYGEAVGYAFVQAMMKAGKNPTRADLVNAINARAAAGPGGGALRLLRQRSRRDHRRLHRRDQERRARPAGPGLRHRRQPDRGGHRVQRIRAGGARQRDAIGQRPRQRPLSCAQVLARHRRADPRPVAGRRLAPARPAGRRPPHQPVPRRRPPGRRHERGVAAVTVAANRRAAVSHDRPPAQRLLRAAEELFGESSYRQATVAGICARAGIATGSFYAHFSSKAEIFAAVVRQINADLRHGDEDGARAGGR